MGVVVVILLYPYSLLEIVGSGKIGSLKIIILNLSYNFPIKETRKIIYYQYETKYPHAGAGKRIQF